MRSIDLEGFGMHFSRTDLDVLVESEKKICKLLIYNDWSRKSQILNLHGQLGCLLPNSALTVGGKRFLGDMICSLVCDCRALGWGR
jgi:hypothetical protein